MTPRTTRTLLTAAMLPLALFLGGCPVGLDPCTNASVVFNKSTTCPSLEIAAGEKRTFEGNIKITSASIVVNGTLSGAKGTPGRVNGSSLELDCMGGTATIAGTIEAGSGLEQRTGATGGATVAGAAGGEGGDITIRTCASLDIGAEGKLKAGDGGRGQNATAEGSSGTVQAISGLGGRGGDILIESVQRSVIVGDLRAGDGKTSGEAKATGKSEPGSESFPLRVEAEGAVGPRGGNIRFNLTDPQATVFIRRTGAGQQPLRADDPKATAGKGGPAGTATAAGGDQATATSGNSGDGGTIRVTLCNSCGFNFSNATTVPGDGGRAALAAQEAATASGFTQATATTGKGGDGGRVFVGDNPTVVEGKGGPSGAVRAKTADGSCLFKKGDDPMNDRIGGVARDATVRSGDGDQCP